MLDASIARKTGTYRNHTQSFSSLWPRRRIELCAHFPFPPSSRQPLPSDLKGPDNPRHLLISTMELCIVLRAWVRSLTCLLHYVLKTWLIWLWPMNMSSPKLLILRHESILILYRELSSPIFQSLWVSKASVTPVHPDIHFVQYKKA